MSFRNIAAVTMVLLIAALIATAIWGGRKEAGPRRVEAREIAQIVFTDEASARAVERRLAKGEDFATLAAENRSDSYWKLYTRAEFAAITSPAVADAAFAAPAGGFGKAAESDYGWHVVHVLRIFPVHR
ncbi:MAG TPA: peptidyl-prolyl cis-trans isomerase [Allosphingosinicella sp.]|jgi:peptidyl-prolyl cis-trans isomerase D